MAMNDVRQMAGRSVTDLPAPSLTRHRKWWGLLFVAPAVLFFAVFAIFPIGFGVYLSFTRYDLLTPPQWIGLGNYTGLFRDRAFLVAIGNTMLFVFGATVPVWVLSLWLALRFDRCFASRNIWKSLFFSPVLPPLVVRRRHMEGPAASEWIGDGARGADIRRHGNTLAYRSRSLSSGHDRGE